MWFTTKIKKDLCRINIFQNNMENSRTVFKLTILKLLVCISFAVVPLSLVQAQENKENVTCKEFLDLVNQYAKDTNYVVLDVRTKKEFNEGYLKNAINIDYNSSEFDKDINKLNRDKTYLIYCKGGVRSAKAIEIMKSFGFTKFYHLFEGLDEWDRLKYEIVKPNKNAR